jgi:hypothetical protein
MTRFLRRLSFRVKSLAGRIDRLADKLDNIKPQRVHSPHPQCKSRLEQVFDMTSGTCPTCGAPTKFLIFGGKSERTHKYPN